MVFQKVALTIFLTIFLSAMVFAQSTNGDIEVMIDASSEINPNVLSEVKINISVKNIGDVPVDLQSFNGQIHQLDCSGPCTDFTFFDCLDECGHLEPGQQIFLGAYTFIPAAIFGLSGGSNYKISVSGFTNPQDLDISNNYSSVDFFFIPSILSAYPDTDSSIGAENAEVVILEFGNFASQNSKLFHDHFLPILNDEYIKTEEARYIFRDFASFPGGAFNAAVAANCAKEQSLYWEFNDKLFQNSDHLSDENFIVWAEELDLNLTEFKECLTFKEAAIDEVKKDTLHGEIAAVAEASTFFIQRPKCGFESVLVAPESYADFENAIHEISAKECPKSFLDLFVSSTSYGPVPIYETTEVVFDVEVKNTTNTGASFDIKASVLSTDCIDSGLIGSDCSIKLPYCDDIDGDCLYVGPFETKKISLSFVPVASFPTFSTGQFEFDFFIDYDNDIDYSNNDAHAEFIVADALELCEDGQDNDGDFKVDCADNECLAFCYDSLVSKVDGLQSEIRKLNAHDNEFNREIREIKLSIEEFSAWVSLIFCDKLNICPAGR